LWRSQAQQPLSDGPGATVRFTEPPSDVGTAGPQIGAPAPAAPAEDAVVLAAFEDESGASPGSCNGTCELRSDDAPTASGELDWSAVPVATGPLAVAPVVSFVAVPVVVPLAPMVDLGDVDADVPEASEVVLVPCVAAAPFGAAVVLLSEFAVVVLLDVPVVMPCAFVELAVCAWSAVAPSSPSAMERATMTDLCGIARMPERMPSDEFRNARARLCFMTFSCLVTNGSAAVATCA
jgi:hypothetical protein